MWFTALSRGRWNRPWPASLPLFYRFTFCVFALFLLNFFIAHALFFTEYSDRVISGDAAFISISRYMRDHAGDSSWWPIWYNGIPGHNAYPPLLHKIVALSAQLQSISPALSHHQFSVVVFSLAPVSLFCMVYRLTRNLSSSVIAGVGFTVLSPSTLLIPWVRTGASGWFGPWRLTVLEAYGDAPHMLALALIPVAVIAMDAALERRRGWPYLRAAVTIACIFLTNWLGSVALICALGAYFAARTNRLADLSRVWLGLCIVVAGYLLACPWIPPSTISLIRSNGQVADGDFRADMKMFPIRALAIIVILALLKYLFVRYGPRKDIQFSLFLLIVPGMIPLLHEFAGVDLLPQPHRYQWEMDLAIWLALALAGAAIRVRLGSRSRLIFLWVALLLSGVQVARYERYSSALVHPIDMQRTVEYQAAHWLQTKHPGARVFAIGTVAYWMNAFSDVQQASGGFDPATPNEANRMALQTISVGTDASREGSATALVWLRALGVDFAVVGGPKTRAPFRTFKEPGKFDSIASKVWASDDDYIYMIPRRNRSLAHVVRPGDVPRSAAYPELKRYVDDLEDPNQAAASFAWNSGHGASIEANVPQGNVVSVQINYDPGWHATVNGAERPIARDGLGFMTIDPGCIGACTLALTYNGGTEAAVTWFACCATIAVGIGMSLVRWRGSRSAHAADQAPDRDSRR